MPWALGPADGRYLLRPRPEADVEHVLVLRTLGAKQRRLLSRKSQPAPPGDPEAEPVPTTRATVVLTDEPLADDAAGRAWLRDAGDDDVDRAFRALNMAVRAHRLATADPTVREVSREQALVVRLGYGAGEEVAYGNWKEARALAPDRRPRGRRATLLRPAERLAGLLGGRESALVCEDLILRTRLDVDHGQFREAALQLEAALAAALVELEGDERRDLPKRRAELEGRRDEVTAAAQAARQGDLDAEQREVVTSVLGRLEAVLRSRTMASDPGPT